MRRFVSWALALAVLIPSGVGLFPVPASAALGGGAVPFVSKFGVGATYQTAGTWVSLIPVELNWQAPTQAPTGGDTYQYKVTQVGGTSQVVVAQTPLLKASVVVPASGYTLRIDTVLLGLGGVVKGTTEGRAGAPALRFDGATLTYSLGNSGGGSGGGSGSGTPTPTPTPSASPPFEMRIEKTFSELYARTKDSVLAASKAPGADGDRMRDWWIPVQPTDGIFSVTEPYKTFNYPGDRSKRLHNSAALGGRNHQEEVGPFQFYLELVDGKSGGFPVIDHRTDRTPQDLWVNSFRAVYDTTHRHVEHLAFRQDQVVDKVNALLQETTVAGFETKLGDLKTHVEGQIIPQTVVTWAASMNSHYYITKNTDAESAGYVSVNQTIAKYKTGATPFDVSGQNSKRLRKPVWISSGKTLSKGDDTKVYKQAEDFWSDMAVLANIAYQDPPANEEELKEFKDRMAASMVTLSGTGNTANTNEGDLRCGKTGGINPIVYIKAAFCGFVANLQDTAKFLVVDGVNFVLVGAGIPSSIQSGGILSSTLSRAPLYSAPVEDIVRSQQLGGLVRLVHGQILGLMNAFVIIVLIALALLTIAQVQVSTYSIKKYLPAVVVSVVLANVSFFATVAMYEVSGAVSNAFFDRERVASAGTPIGSTAEQVTVYQTTFSNFAFGPNGEYLKMVGDNGEADMGKVFRGAIFAAVLFVAAFLLIWLGLLFMLRPLILVVCAATSGLAFFGAGFPLLNFIWKRWSKLAFNWAFMPVVALFWIWLGAQFFGVTQQSAANDLGVVSDVISFAAGIYCIWLAVRTPFSMAGEAKALVDKVDKGLRGGARGVSGAGLALGRGATQAALGSERYKATRDRFLQGRVAALGGGLTRQGRINTYEDQKKRLEEQLLKEKDPAKRKKIQAQLDSMKKRYEAAVQKKAKDGLGSTFFSKDYTKNAEANMAAIDKLDVSDAEKNVLRERFAKNKQRAEKIQDAIPGGVLGIPGSLVQAFTAGQAAFDEQVKFFKGGGDRRKQRALSESRGIVGIANRGRKALEAREEVEKEVIQSAGKVLSEILDGMKADLRAGRLSEVLHNEARRIKQNDLVADKERALEAGRTTFYEGEAAIATALGTKSLLEIETAAAAKREKAEKDLKKRKSAITTTAAADASTLYTAMDEVKSADFTEAERLLGNLKNAGQRRELKELIDRARTSHADISAAVRADPTFVTTADQDAEIEKRCKDKKTDAGYEMLSKAAKVRLYGDADISDAVQKKYAKDRAKELKEIKETIADGDHIGVFGFKGDAKDGMKVINTLARDNEHLVDGDISKKLVALRDQVSRGKVYGEAAGAVNDDLTKLVDFANDVSANTADYTPEERTRAARVAAEAKGLQDSLIRPLTLITSEQEAKQHAGAVSVDKNLANIGFEEAIVAKPDTVYSTPKKAVEKEQKVVDSRQKLITAQRVATLEKAKTQPNFVKSMQAFYRKNGLGTYDPLDIVVDSVTATVANAKTAGLPAAAQDEFIVLVAGAFAGGGGKKGKGAGKAQLKIRPEEDPTSAFAAQFGAIPDMKMK